VQHLEGVVARVGALKRSQRRRGLLCARSFSSSATIARNASLDSTWVGPKCRRANVDFPEPEMPISTTIADRGISIT
jgi:hypothetical protein